MIAKDNIQYTLTRTKLLKTIAVKYTDATVFDAI
jgi:hypothetical protein